MQIAAALWIIGNIIKAITIAGLNMAIDANSLEAAMAIENRNQILCSNTEDAKEGMRAFIEKRDPVYTGR